MFRSDETVKEYDEEDFEVIRFSELVEENKEHIGFRQRMKNSRKYLTRKGFVQFECFDSNYIFNAFIPTSVINTQGTAGAYANR